MNHLAHFHLAGNSRPRVVGALLADYLKGPLEGRLPPELELGVRLHRRTDAWTDGHSEVRALRACFDPPVRRVAGIVLDVYFDLVLARHWRRFHEQDLSDFSRNIYHTLREHAALLPRAGQLHAQRMAEHDLLCAWADTRVANAALQRIGLKLGMAEQMEGACATAGARLGEIEDAFLALYPQAMAMARDYTVNAG